MSTAPKLMIQTMWDVTIVNFEEARLLEAHQIESLGQQLYPLVDEMDRKKILLDFTKVQFLASAALGMLMNLHRKSAKIKGTIVLCGVRKEIMKVFEIMKLTKLFTFADDEKGGLKAFGYLVGH